MSFDTPGRQSYVLDTLTDGLGNVGVLSQPTPSKATPHLLSTNVEKSTVVLTKENSRVVVVLRRAMVSFSDCAPGHPATLLIGSETQLRATANDADMTDAPWDVVVNYQPAVSSSSGNFKQVKAWKKTFVTQPGGSLLTIDANAPGEYTLASIKGKYCTGEILSPDTCKVVLQPLPTAEIKWKRIHEWCDFYVFSENDDLNYLIVPVILECPHSSFFTEGRLSKCIISNNAIMKHLRNLSALSKVLGERLYSNLRAVATTLILSLN